MSKIIELRTENVKRLKAVRIRPDGSLVIIGGRNAQGKSSVLDSIAGAFGGSEQIATVPVRTGAEKATTVIDLGDMIVRRTIQPNGNTSLVIEDKEKRRYPSPQALLDSLTGRLTFDPLSFISQEPKQQLVTLKNLVGVDFTADDLERQRIYNERTVVNREVERAQISLSQAAHYPDVKEAVDVTALQAELQAAQKHNENYSTLKLDLSDKQAAFNAELESVRRGEDKLKELQSQLFEIQAKIDQTKAQNITRAQAAEKSKAVLHEVCHALNEFKRCDTVPIQEKILSATEHNRKQATNQARATQERTLADKKAEAEKLTKSIEEIDQRKQKKLTDAKFPVEGLSFGAGEVTFNGLPFSQASQAEQMRVSVGIAAAMNPKLRVALVRNGSLLDQENLALLEKLATEHDLQVWIERVGTADPSAIIIEDGMVQGAPVEMKQAEPETKPGPGLAQPAKQTKKAKPETQQPFKDFIP